jgi:hypothetical protein
MYCLFFLVPSKIIFLLHIFPFKLTFSGVHAPFCSFLPIFSAAKGIGEAGGGGKSRD